MIKETVYFSEDKSVRLECYLHEYSHEMPYRKERPAVVICPGGGYSICSDREADPVALGYLAAGFNAFIFYYSLGEKAEFPRPLLELSQAIAYIRENAEKFGVIADNIAICGFSAGGHLAASLGVHWNADYITEKTGYKNGENKPNALILGYPVISTSWMERGALNRIIGSNDREWAYKELNLQVNVTKDTPPAFLFHTFRDDAVPVADSIKFALALEEKDIPFEMHIYPNGFHGLSLSTADVCADGGDKDVAAWFNLSVNWLKRLFYNAEKDKTSMPRAKYLSTL